MIEPEKKTKDKDKDQQAARDFLAILEMKGMKSEEFQKKMQEIYERLILDEDDNNQYIEEISVFEFCLRYFPDHLQLLYSYTEYLCEHEYFNRVIPYFQKIAELEPNSSFAWYSLGSALHRANNGDSEEELSDPEHCLRIALKLDDSYQDAWACLAKVYIRKEKFEEAIACLEEALDLDEKYEDYDYVLFLLGHVHQKIKNGDLAIEFYKKSLDIDPTHDLVWNNLGTEYATRFQFNEAIQMYVRGLSFNDENVTTWLNLKSAYIGTEQFKKADYCEEKARKLKQRYHPRESYETPKKEDKKDWHVDPNYYS